MISLGGKPVQARTKKDGTDTISEHFGLGKHRVHTTIDTGYAVLYGVGDPNP